MNRMHTHSYLSYLACVAMQEADANVMVVQRYLKTVEDLFRKKAINVVFATESLSLGVNMPIHSVCFIGDSDKLTPTTAQQMSGRAGRRGLDLEGNVVAINISQVRECSRVGS